MLPPDVDSIRDELLRLYKAAGEEIDDLLLDLATDPDMATRFRQRQQLTEMRKAVVYEMDALDDAAKVWTRERMPTLYQMAGRRAELHTGTPFAWTQIHRDAATVLAKSTFSELLGATQYVRDDVRRFVRVAAKQRTTMAIITGTQTAVSAGRDLATIIRNRFATEGLAAITYKNGARHGIGDFADSVIRTKSAEMFNTGTINVSREAGITYMECFDGWACCLESHSSGPLANGLVLPMSTAETYMQSHVRCARAWSPRSDVHTPEEAEAARRYSREEQERMAELERERAKVYTVTGRLSAAERRRRGYAARVW